MKEITVLIVEDEQMLCDAIAFGFLSSGMKVLKANNGKDGLKFIQRNPDIDIVITDIRMPDEDGISLLDKIRSFDKDIPVIISTGFMDISRDEAFAKGANAIINKPFRFESLLAEVQKLLGVLA